MNKIIYYTYIFMFFLQLSVTGQPVCDETIPPQNPVSFVVKDEVVIHWDTVPGSLGCQAMASTPVSSVASRKVVGFEQSEFRIPNSVTVPGWYTWKVRCACNLSPLVSTPFSAVDTFFIPDSFECGSVTDVEGNLYTGIQIGTQCWLQQNLRTSRYPDGTSLVDGTGVGDITGDYVTRYYFSYQDNPLYADTFGYLYTWAAIMNGSPASDAIPSGVQGICPDGWHVPSIREWDILDRYLGGNEVSGGPLKDTIYWKPPNIAASNSSGFSALPTGDRIDFGAFVNVRENADWWSASDGGYVGNAWIRCLYYENDNFGRAILATGRKAAAFPCRCVKD